MNGLSKPSDRFVGDWNLRRDIYDLDSEWIGRFKGGASFVENDGGLDYAEEGKLQFGGLTAIKATRKYRWTFPGGTTIAVLFDDGRDFHEFDSSQKVAQASHYCDPDEYDVTYDFSRWPEWRAAWRVEGPRKSYRMVSIYTRD